MIGTRSFSLRTRSQIWVGTVVCLTLAQVVATSVLPRGPGLTILSDILCSLVMLSCFLVFAANAIAASGRIRTFWILQAAGWLCWLADQMWWMVYDIILKKPIPPVFAGDGLLFLAGVPMLAGLLLRPHLQPSERSARLGQVDFWLLLLWWVYFYVYLVISWQYIALNLPFYNRNYDCLYMVEVVIMAAVLLTLLKQSSGQWKRFYTFYLAATLFYSAAFMLQNRAIELGSYFNGSWYDIVYMAAFVVFVVVALSGAGLEPRQETPEDEMQVRWMARFGILAVLSLPVIAVTAATDYSAPLEVVRFRVIVSVATMFTMAGLVFIKQHRLHHELQRANQVLEDAVVTDPLTGARNRRFFSSTIESDIGRSLRAHTDGHDTETRDLVFYLIDADNFKEVNDWYGHDAGDRVLIEMARRISSAIRNSDILVRWGGEEFLIVSRYTNRREAETLARRVLHAVGNEPYLITQDGEAMPRTCSIGWAAFPWMEADTGAATYGEVLDLADQGLRQAKGNGKNRAVGMVPSQQSTNRIHGNARQLAVKTMAVAGPSN